MSKVLGDGTVIPSYLGTTSRGVAEDMGDLSNTSLRLGEVVGRVYPGDKKSQTKKYVEYKVEVQFRDGSGPANRTVYRGCLLANLFGAGADIFRYGLRVDTKETHSNDDLGVGAKVLLLCVNGETTRAYIIGGIRDALTEPDEFKDKAADGHNLLWEFNGVRATVNNEGELSVAFRGKTNSYGELDDDVDADAGGATITFTKEGSLNFQDAKGSQVLSFDHPDKSVFLSAAERLETHAPQGTIIDSESGNINLTSQGTYIGGGAAVDALVKGSAYRRAETQMHSKMLTALGTMATLLASLSTLSATAGASLAGAAAVHVIPVAGPIAGAPMMASAAAAYVSMAPILGTLSTMVTQLIAAITAFEAGTATFLSTKNYTD